MYREVDAHLSLCLLLFTSFDHTDGIKMCVQLDSRWTNRLKCDPLLSIYPACILSSALFLSRYWDVYAVFRWFVGVCYFLMFVCNNNVRSHFCPLTFTHSRVCRIYPHFWQLHTFNKLALNILSAHLHIEQCICTVLR